MPSDLRLRSRRFSLLLGRSRCDVPELCPDHDSDCHRNKCSDTRPHARTLPEQADEPVEQPFDAGNGQGVVGTGRLKDRLAGTLTGPVLQVGPGAAEDQVSSAT